MRKEIGHVNNLPKIASLFDARVKQQVPDLVEAIAVWNSARTQADEWQDEADRVWGDLISKVAKLLDQAIIDDPIALPKLAQWLKTHVGIDVNIVTQLRRSTRELADIIAHAIVAASAALTTRAEDIDAGAPVFAKEELAQGDARVEE